MQNALYNHHNCLLITSLYLILSMLIGDGAFQYCSSLSKVELTSGLTVIGRQMFFIDGGATLLSSITIPSTVTSIGRSYYYYYMIHVIMSTSVFLPDLHNNDDSELFLCLQSLLIYFYIVY